MADFRNLPPNQLMGLMAIHRGFGGSDVIGDSMGLLSQMQRDKMAMEQNQRANEAAQQQGLLFQQGQEDRDYTLSQRDITAQTAAQEKAAMEQWIAGLPPEEQAVARANPTAAYDAMIEERYKQPKPKDSVIEVDDRLFDLETREFITDAETPEQISVLKNSELLGERREYQKRADVFKASKVFFDDIKDNVGAGGVEGQENLNPHNPYSDWALLNRLTKMYDPNSAVLVSEADVIEQRNSLPGRVSTYFSQILTGESLTPKQRKQIYNVAASKMDSAIDSQSQFEKETYTFADTLEMDKKYQSKWFPSQTSVLSEDYTQRFDLKQQPAANANSGTNRSLANRRTNRGQRKSLMDTGTMSLDERAKALGID